jgi:hypothetical protein
MGSLVEKKTFAPVGAVAGGTPAVPVKSLSQRPKTLAGRSAL